MLDSCLVTHVRLADGITPGSNREAYTFRLTLIGILNGSAGKEAKDQTGHKNSANHFSLSQGGGRYAAATEKLLCYSQAEADTQTVP